MNRRLTTILLTQFLLAAGCATGREDAQSERCRHIFLAEMRSDGVLLVHDLRIHGSGAQNVINTVPPSRPDYADQVAWAGSPRPGESRPVPRYDGSVTMDADGVITIIQSGDPYGDLVAEPSMGFSRPGQPGYAELIERVGGLEPGHFKGLPSADVCHEDARERGGDR